MLDKRTVFHSKLGMGTIISETTEFYMVLLKITPPFEFNACVNPCLVLKSSVSDMDMSWIFLGKRP